MYKVSICIPTYSRLNYLKELVSSCLIQTFSDFEICISQDVTPQGLLPEIHEYCLELAAQYSDTIKYLAQKENLGLARNWNALVAMARGKYIFVPGDDDLIAPDFLEKMISSLTEDADVIFCNQNFINANGLLMKDITTQLNHKYKRDCLSDGFIAEPIRIVLQNSVPMSATLIKRKWFTEISFDQRINTPELEVFLKIAVKGGNFYYINEKLASYRIHQTSATSSGLSIGQFLSNIIDIEVPSQYTEDKTRLIKSAIVPGINNAIKNKSTFLAKKLFRSAYYPNDSYFRRTIQRILINMPNFISRFILNRRK